jgi:hypothetical protein
MSRKLKVALVTVAGLFVLLAAAQLVRPPRTNPPIDATRTLQSRVGATNGLAAVVDRSCGDCHSNATVWTRYTNVAPLSWVITHGVNEGRRILNFSEWAAYTPEKQQALLVASCKTASNGKMPGSAYLMVRPEARLSAQDVETICAASRGAALTSANAAPTDPGSVR